ncbi:conserved hypothetical protein [Sulfolobus islandicus Y.N.15.51]|jgi:DNA-binding MarR family transcriptional regulator|uniref:DUF4443 domain-containing protein n=1 Tax=Saccharolobus islandicus (strain Y.N.15.51 / Yellowstone \|nr:DUF4443 domain-containing protein [Sulfolobus islandicus]ACP48605.1 conserved hypothetical protein [Sulfolobus islandicus Y.N.15.51]
MDIQIVLTKAVETRQGNKPKFDEGHVIMSLFYISQLQPVGRILLMKKTGLSEASIKTLLKRLREMKLIQTDPVGGNTLTEEGNKIVSCIKNTSNIKNVTLKSLGWNSSMLIIRGGAELLKKIPVLHLRDEIIRLGAEKVLVCVHTEEGKIEIPPKTEEMSLKGLLEEIKENCENCGPNDLIIFLVPNKEHLGNLTLAFILKVLKKC